MHYLIGAAVVAVGVFAIIGMVAKADRWQKFSVEHDCRVVESVSATTSYGYRLGYNGKFENGPIHTPAKTAYLCDDGVKYWR